MEAQEAINTLEAGDKITVEYENTRGNITEKSGKVVHVGNGVNVDTLEEKDDGTPITFTITRWGRVKSTTGSTERRLSDGEIDVSVEGDNEEDTEDETLEITDSSHKLAFENVEEGDEVEVEYHNTRGNTSTKSGVVTSVPQDNHIHVDTGGGSIKVSAFGVVESTTGETDKRLTADSCKWSSEEKETVVRVERELVADGGVEAEKTQTGAPETATDVAELAFEKLGTTNHDDEYPSGDLTGRIAENAHGLAVESIGRTLHSANEHGAAGWPDEYGGFLDAVVESDLNVYTRPVEKENATGSRLIVLTDADADILPEGCAKVESNGGDA